MKFPKPSKLINWAKIPGDAPSTSHLEKFRFTKKEPASTKNLTNDLSLPPDEFKAKYIKNAAQYSKDVDEGWLTGAGLGGGVGAAIPALLKSKLKSVLLGGAIGGLTGGAIGGMAGLHKWKNSKKANDMSDQFIEGFLKRAAEYNIPHETAIKILKQAKIEIKPSHKGLLHKNLGIPGGEKIPAGSLESAKSHASPAEKKRLQFAINSRKWKH